MIEKYIRLKLNFQEVNMKKYKLLLATIFLLAVLPMVMAATTLISPATNTNHTGTVTLNCTTTVTDCDECLNATFWYNSSGGTTGTLLTTIINDTADDTEFYEASYSISGLTDSTTYNITCRVSNASNVDVDISAANDGITFDSTNPTCSFERNHKTMAWKGVQLVEWTSADALSLISTGVTIDRPEEGADMTYTDANKELTLTSQDTKYLGDWSAKLGAIDRAGNTCNESITWKTYLPDGVGTPGYEEEKAAGIPGWLMIAVIGLIGYFIFKKK